MNKLLALLPQADLYLQDEVRIAFHPTLTRVWCRKGRRGQRLVQAPGKNEKQWGFGLVLNGGLAGFGDACLHAFICATEVIFGQH